LCAVDEKPNQAWAEASASARAIEPKQTIKMKIQIKHKYDNKLRARASPVSVESLV
jgi:hypothetical protein